ncbi:sodium-dependent dopamine transporter-like [Ornithodoros turicata]|uniref:sodium-dependent dopamine transporter-like n=1 Tax=Ornithodoros turicata TaxID=34597 RepID=UPI0031396161
MDTYSAGLSLIFIGFCEVTAVMWIYGVNNFSEDISFMVGSTPSLLMRICWAYVIPGVLFVLTFHGFFHAIPITYNNTDPYPEYANIFGWCIAALSMVQIPLWAIVALYNRRNNLKSAFLPTEDWGPRDPQDFREYRALRWPLEKPPSQSPPAPSPTKVLNVPHDAPAVPHNAPDAPHNAPDAPHNAPDATHNKP